MSQDAEFDPENSNLALGPINKPRWIYSCAKQINTMADLAWEPKVVFADALRSIFEAYRHDVAAARHLMD